MAIHRDLRGLRRLTRYFAFAGLATIGALGAPASLLAAETAYPQQAVNIIVPFAPGGSLDATARVLADKLKDVLGHPVRAAQSVRATSPSPGPMATTSSSPRARPMASFTCWCPTSSSG